MNCRLVARRMEILVVGAGTMGAQIAAEYAVGGHRVTTLTRRPETAATKVDIALASLIQLGLRSQAEIATARSCITSRGLPAASAGLI
jgi:3-hydroxyacyl-CoA dehydrogenase